MIVCVCSMKIPSFLLPVVVLCMPGSTIFFGFPFGTPATICKYFQFSGLIHPHSGYILYQIFSSSFLLAHRFKSRHSPKLSNSLSVFSTSNSVEQNLTSPQLLKKSPAFYETRKFITAFTTAHIA